MSLSRFSFVLFFLFSGFISAQTDNCAREGVFGDTPFCLPVVEGWNECYTYAPVKERADATEAPTNTVLGYYICDSNYVHIDNFENIDLNNFFKVYGTNAISQIDTDTSYLNEIEGLFNNGFFEEKWEDIGDSIEELLEDVSVGVPQGIETYKLSDDSFTSIMLIKYNVEGYGSFTMSMACSGMIINKRIIWLAYYLLYEDKSTIDMLKKNNEVIIRAFLESN